MKCIVHGRDNNNNIIIVVVVMRAAPGHTAKGHEPLSRNRVDSARVACSRRFVSLRVSCVGRDYG